MLLAIFLALPSEAATAVASGDRVRSLIQLAGNAHNEGARLTYLKEIRRQSNLNENLNADLGKLTAEIERWTNSKQLPYFSREISRKKDWDFKIASDSPLYPLTYLYRARMLIWYTLESGGVWNAPERRRQFLGKARHFLEAAKAAFPGNRIVRMYLGEPIASAKRYSSVPGAPEWAVHQREGLERLADIIE